VNYENYFDVDAHDNTPIAIYQKIKSLNPCFLLESVEGGDKEARYSFIGIQAHSVLEIKDGEAQINERKVHYPSTRSDWKSLLRSFLNEAPSLTPLIPKQPFSGGFIGATGYECAYEFESVKVNKDLKKRARAIYIAPSAMLIFDHHLGKIALLDSSSKEERKHLKNKAKELITSTKFISHTSSYLSAENASIQDNQFLNAVTKAKKNIYDGDIFQVVLSIKFSGTSGIDPISCYEKLRALNTSPYHYLFENKDLCIVGSSPEALVKLEDNEAFLKPIAGTKPRGKTPIEDDALEEELINDPKEKAEHVMLIDLARNDLGRVAIEGSISVEPYMVIERYSHVMHIVGGVKGRLAPEYDAFDLFMSAFPAGTLVGAPKIKAMEIIAGLEPCKRDFYGGTVGYFSKNGNMDQAITIRTVVFEGERYSFQAGAGIVADSTPEGELKEIMAKSDVLRRALSSMI